ncbi:MAG: WYL domain-containing protein [Epsilonproteobacteria bacterium]|nr:WYL domain-containing protein [Campylobacterota bacterium]
MQKRKTIIYNQLFNKICSKDELAKVCGNVSTKTIENTVKECDDIVYSKKLGAYHFKDLFPTQISYQNYLDLFKDNLSNSILKDDMIKSISEVATDLNTIMIDTTKLSELSKKVIKLKIAINHNCMVKVSYKRGEEERKDRYIQPNQIITHNTIYYLYLTYDERNKSQEEKGRPFAFNSIQNIEPIEYLKDKTLQTFKIANAFGYLDDANKKVTLKLKEHAAHFFKREGLFKNPYYKFLSEDSNGEIEMEMIYKKDIEVVKLVQQWMPLIYVVNDSTDAKEIINGIEQNYNDFLSGCNR